MKNLKYYLQKAVKEKWAIGHFNFYDFERLASIVKVAQELKSPVIVAVSERASRLIGLKKIALMVNALKKKIDIPVFLNLDHGKSFDYIKEAVDIGYDSVHFDGSDLPLSKNIELAKKLADYAHRKKVLIEGEVGVIGGRLTEVEDALKFTKETKVDILAISIGNIHGIRQSGINPRLDLKRLKEINKKTKTIPLVLHGGSGTPAKDVKVAVKAGIAIVHINTELKNAYKESGSKGVEQVVKKKIKLLC